MRFSIKNLIKNGNITVVDPGLQVAASSGIKRSSKWAKTAKKYLKEHPACEICGETEHVQVHHIFPFHYAIALGRPDLEFDFRNLITLCQSQDGEKEQNHHLLIGHLNDFRSSNLNVRSDVEKYKNKTMNEIKEDKDWLIEQRNKLTPLDRMSDQEKQEFKDLMDKIFPINE